MVHVSKFSASSSKDGHEWITGDKPNPACMPSLSRFPGVYASKAL